MQQLKFDETDHERIIRLNKNGWYNGNRLASAEIPGYIKCPEANPGPDIPTLKEEIAAYQRDMSKVRICKARRQERIGQSVFARQRPAADGDERGIDPATMKVRG